MTSISTVPIYPKDLELVKKFRDDKRLKNLAEAMKVIVEYAKAHGVFV
jgi:predicted house-cleaning noncanonical NTP pyrophosphatase (MazG superfamily)